MNRSTLSGLLTSVLLAGCDTTVDNPPVGDLEITTSPPALAAGIQTADGWAIAWRHLFVHVTAVAVQGDDGVLTASAAPQILDLAAPEPVSILSATVRTARTWENVTLQIGPAAPDREITLAPPVTEADRDAMVAGGFSIHVDATATKAGVVKSLVWDFVTDTLHKDCKENELRGVVVPPNATGTASITLDGSVLFSEDLTAPGASLRADALAAADADGDGAVTLDELHAVTLETARASGGAYAAAPDAGVADLGAFVETLTRNLVRTYQTAGTCTPEPVVAGDEAAE
jgi:hypothetical protein